MELRAVPAKRLLAPLAVLVPIGATPMLPTSGALVFLAVGCWGVRTRRNFTVVPLAGLLGVLVLLLLVAAVPGIQGTCET